MKGYCELIVICMYIGHVSANIYVTELENHFYG